MNSLQKAESIRVRLRQIIAAGGAASAEEVLDLRELEAPLPLERALLRAARLASGESFIAWTPRVPQMLLARLTERGFHHVVEAAADHSALVHIERP